MRPFRTASITIASSPMPSVRNAERLSASRHGGRDAVAGAVREIDARDVAARGALFEQPRNGHILVVLVREYEKDAQR